MQNTAIRNQIPCVLCSAAHIIMHIRISKTLLKKLCTAQLLSKARSERCIYRVICYSQLTGKEKTSGNTFSARGCLQVENWAKIGL